MHIDASAALGSTQSKINVNYCLINWPFKDVCVHCRCALLCTVCVFSPVIRLETRKSSESFLHFMLQKIRAYSTTCTSILSIGAAAGRHRHCRSKYPVILFPTVWRGDGACEVHWDGSPLRSFGDVNTGCTCVGVLAGTVLGRPLAQCTQEVGEWSVLGLQSCGGMLV